MFQSLPSSEDAEAGRTLLPPAPSAPRPPTSRNRGSRLREPKWNAALEGKSRDTAILWLYFVLLSVFLSKDISRILYRPPGVTPLHISPPDKM